MACAPETETSVDCAAERRDGPLACWNTRRRFRRPRSRRVVAPGRLCTWSTKKTGGTRAGDPRRRKVNGGQKSRHLTIRERCPQDGGPATWPRGAPPIPVHASPTALPPAGGHPGALLPAPSQGRQGRLAVPATVHIPAGSKPAAGGQRGHTGCSAWTSEQLRRPAAASMPPALLVPRWVLGLQEAAEANTCAPCPLSRGGKGDEWRFGLLRAPCRALLGLGRR